jgi:hypothetical protein
MKVYVFQSGNRTGFKFKFGFTPNSEGSNLPTAGAPWTLVKTLDVGSAGGLKHNSPGVGPILDGIQTKGFADANAAPVL